MNHIIGSVSTAMFQTPDLVQQPGVASAESTVFVHTTTEAILVGVK